MIQARQIHSNRLQRIIAIFLLTGLFTGKEAHGQSSQVNKQYWMDATLACNISPKLRILQDVSYRRMTTQNHWQQLFINPMLTYETGKHIQLRGSVVFQFTESQDISIYEIRPWEGIQIQFPRIAGFYLQHFVRLEERFFFQNNEGYVSDALRTRYSLMAYIPVNNKQLIDKTFYLWPGMEFFMDIAGVKVERYINKSRFMLGIGYRFSKFYRLELGYMQQYSKINTLEHFTYSDRIIRVLNHFTI